MYSACFHRDPPRFRCSAGGGRGPGGPWGSLGPSITSSASAFRGGGRGRVVHSGTELWGAAGAGAPPGAAGKLGRVGQHPEGARRRTPQDPGPGGARGGAEPAGDQKPAAPHCSPVTLPLALLPLSNTLLSDFLLSPFQRCCLLFSSQPGCFHFFCLKFLRGRFYFQRFD